MIGLFASRLRDGFVAVLFFAFIATLMRNFPTIPDFIVGGFLSSVLIGSVTMPMGYGSKKFLKLLLPSATERRFTDAKTQVSAEATEILRIAEEHGLKVIVADTYVFIGSKHYYNNNEILEFGKSVD